MIREDQLTPIGRVLKPHGISGEMSVLFTVEEPIAVVGSIRCMLFDIDGIFVPFFAETVRPRGSESLLIKFDGIDSETIASGFTGKTVFALSDELSEYDEEDEIDPDNLYAGQLAGFAALTYDGTPIGTISDIDEQTENVLFVVERPDAEPVFIPVVDEFIAEIDIEARKIYFSLPEGILDL